MLNEKHCNEVLPEYMDRELTGEEIFKILMERNKDLLTKLYEGTYEEE
jgi:hypothetical protein